MQRFFTVLLCLIAHFFLLCAISFPSALCSKIDYVQLYLSWLLSDKITFKVVEKSDVNNGTSYETK